VENVRVEIRDRVAVVTLDRPPVNALDYQTFAEIAEAFTTLGREREANVAIFTAAGDKTFCAGVDLQDSPKRFRPDGTREDGGPRGDARDQLDPGRIVRECFGSIYDCSIPVIAAVDSKAIGAGLVLVACCDLVVASHRASFALTEINVGVLGGVRHTQRFVGPYLSRRLFYTGEFVGADELYRRGVIEAVVDTEDLMPTAQALATTIASKSPIAIRLAKESANRVEHLPLMEGYRLEQDYTSRVKRFADSSEAATARTEKRDPDYRWR
jgi:enoyl-CoA hydratase